MYCVRRLREARGLSPAGAEEGRGRIHGANSPYQATTPVPLSSSFPRRRESRGGGGAAQMTPKRFQRRAPIFITWRAGPCRHERLARKWTCQVASHSTLAASLRGSDRSIRHSRDRKHAPYPDTGAGIHALRSGERTPTAIPPPTSTRRPRFVFPAKAHPEPRYGAGIQRGGDGEM